MTAASLTRAGSSWAVAIHFASSHHPWLRGRNLSGPFGLVRWALSALVFLWQCVCFGSFAEFCVMVLVAYWWLCLWVSVAWPLLSHAFCVRLGWLRSCVARLRCGLRSTFRSACGQWLRSSVAIEQCEVMPHGRRPAGSAPAICLGPPSTLSVDIKHNVVLVRPLAAMQTCLPTRPVAVALGPVAAGCWPLKNCAENALNALVNRHAVEQPTCRKLKVPNRLVNFVAGMYAEMALYIPRWPKKWAAAKQRVISESVRLQQPIPACVKPFVKREVNHKMPTKARLIQGYLTPATQARFGPELYAFQKALGFLVDFELFPGIFVTVGSGRTAEFLAAWPGNCPFDCAVLYERDGKNWDATMSREHHQAKTTIMRACDPAMADFIDSCFRVKATFRDSKTREVAFRYTLNGTVKSGHNDTTSGNTLVNLIVVANAMSDLGFRGRCIATGDDLLVQLDPSSIGAAGSAADACASLLRREGTYGIKPEARWFNDLEDATFVSGRWVRDGVRHRFLPLMGRLAARLWWTVKPPSEKKLGAYRYGVASAIRSVTGGALVASGLTRWVPWSRHALRGSQKVETSWAFMGSQSLNRDRVNQALVRIYGLPLSVLEELDRTLYEAGRESVPQRLSSLALDWIIQHDTADIGARPCAAAANRTC